LLRAIIARLLPGAPTGGAPQLPMTWLEASVSGGSAIPVVRQGQGRPIVIVHGGSGDLTSWAAVAARLLDRFTVYRYTRPTYRLRPTPRGAEAMAAEIAELLAVLELVGAPAVVVGHSSGAIVTLEAALVAPNQFAGMVLYEPPLAVIEPLGPDAIRRARAAIEAGKPHQAMAIHLTELVGVSRILVILLGLLPPARKRLDSFADAQITDNEAIESLGIGLDRYARLAVPALLVGGAQSQPHFRGRLTALAGVLPAVDSVVYMPGQAHVANLRGPDQVARVVADFAGALPSVH
jgi:pimeloyl-ACP methyl ester carboxylesterase